MVPIAPALPLRRLAIVIAVVLAPSAAGQGAASGTAASMQASQASASLPFQIEQVEGALPIFVLGPNRFTPYQLSRFVVGVDAFLARAAGDVSGGQVTYRVEGLRGYIALATSPFVDGPAYLLTLRGERVRSFEDDAALLNAVSRLGDRLLASWPDSIPESSASRPRVPADGFPMFLIP